MVGQRWNAHKDPWSVCHRSSIRVGFPRTPCYGDIMTIHPLSRTLIPFVRWHNKRNWICVWWKKKSHGITSNIPWTFVWKRINGVPWNSHDRFPGPMVLIHGNPCGSADHSTVAHAAVGGTSGNPSFSREDAMTPGTWGRAAHVKSSTWHLPSWLFNANLGGIWLPMVDHNDGWLKQHWCSYVSQAASHMDVIVFFICRSSQVTSLVIVASMTVAIAYSQLW